LVSSLRASKPLTGSPSSTTNGKNSAATPNPPTVLYLAVESVQHSCVIFSVIRTGHIEALI
jgi:hypothetical protein